MPDVHTPEIRSYNMSRIRGRNTKPEEIVRKYLFSKGFRYKKNDKSLPGKPDIVLPKYKTVVFINGCFWHMHENCKYFVMPKSNIEFWNNKLRQNVKRDLENHQKLESLGWNVLVVWTCELNKAQFDKRMNELVEAIYQHKKQDGNKTEDADRESSG